MQEILNNIVWHSLCGPHAGFSQGADSVRRYLSGFAPAVGFADQSDPDFDALSGLCAPGERLFCEGWNGDIPKGWQVVTESIACKMVWQGDASPNYEANNAVRLTLDHLADALSLTELTKPGPFGPRTLELGEYYGLFEGDQLVSMAGERFFASGFHEISAVCTHPDYQGRGMAKRLMQKLISRQLSRGETPFLHVRGTNAPAIGLYERLGFALYRESLLRVISRVS